MMSGRPRGVNCGAVDAVIHQDPDSQARLVVETGLERDDGAARNPPGLLKVGVYFRASLP